MNKLRYLLPLALVSAALAVPAASAAPSPIHLSVSSNARYVSPTTILVPVTVTCPAGLTAFVQVTVQEQNAANATGFGFNNTATCTGSAQSLVVVVNGAGFTPGKAYAQGFASDGFFFVQDTRQIQIVV
jgi:hypothetical protein